MSTLDRRLGFIFRCDGTRAVGLGHVSRCLALAEALEERGCRCVFLGDYDDAAAALLNHARMAWVRAECAPGSDAGVREVASVAAVHGLRWGVVDSYSVTDGSVAALQRMLGGIVVLDDFHLLGTYDCSCVLNFTVSAATAGYPCREGLRLLLGPDYFLARKRLRELRRKNMRDRPLVQHLLIAIGGTDRHGISEQVARSLLDAGYDGAVRVVMAQAAGGIGRLQEILRAFPAGELLCGVPDLAEQYEWADLCVSGGGLTKYECAFVGVPAVVVSQTREEEIETADFVAQGLAVNAGICGERGGESFGDLISEVISDGVFRAALAARGRQRFPDDPTANAAEAIKSLVLS